MSLDLEHPRLRGIIRDRRAAASDEWLSTKGKVEIYSRKVKKYQSHVEQARSGESFNIRRAGVVRNDDTIDTVVLHVTTGPQFLSLDRSLPEPSEDTEVSSDHRVDRINAHFVVLNNGTIVYTRDIGHILNNAGGRRGIDIEFAGRYGLKRNPRGNRPLYVAAGNPEESIDILTRRTIDAARALIRSLYEDVGVRYIHPHGQSNAGKRDTCPGPDIWLNIGEWAVEALRMSAYKSAGSFSGDISSKQNNYGYLREF